MNRKKLYSHTLSLFALLGGCSPDSVAMEGGTDGTGQFESDSSGATESPGDGDGDGDAGDGDGDGDAGDGDGTGPVCGDGVVSGDEECDDGNPNDNDTCTNDCKLAFCGDGIVGPDEQCDDLNTDQTDACLNNCSPASCGDGFVFVGMEECDDGNVDDSDACTSTCQVASCDDGLHNGGESDIDCGGPCTPCPPGADCVEGADCETLVCSNAICRYPETCADLHAQEPLLPSGAYWIDIDGPGPGMAFEVRCEMDTDGGGWTLLQRTVWDPAETLPLRTNYQTWRSTTVGSLDLSRGYRLAGMYWEHFNDTKEHLLVHYMRNALDLQSCDPLYYKGTGGDLNVGMSTTYLTGIMSPVSMFALSEMSTTNSGPNQQCMNMTEQGVPWFYGNCCSTCPVFKGFYWAEPHPMISYSGTPDIFGNTRANVCEGGEAILTLSGNSFRGVNVMEYYIR